MTEKEQEKLKTLEKWETENQGLIKDGWKILEVYRQTSGSYNKYAVIECVHCGFTKLVLYYNFLKKSPVPCSNCGGKWNDWAENMIGKVVGHYKILSFVRLIKRESNKKVDVFFKVQCIHCGAIREELYSNSNWNRYDTCPDCPRRKTTYLELRYKEYILSAKQRHKEWSLSYNDFCKISTGNCYYCGQEAQLQFRTQSGCNTALEGKINGIDRIDPEGGYTIDNCVPCCSHCNMMKMHYSKDSFLKQVVRIYNHSIKQGQTTIENTSLDGSQQSTLQANGNGNGGPPEMEGEIV